MRPKLKEPVWQGLIEPERQVLTLLARGLDVGQIAEQLGMPIRIVLHHRRILCMKAGTHRSSVMKQFARYHGLY